MVNVGSLGSSHRIKGLVSTRPWQTRDPDNRKLVIVRPGVVFGPGEGGNVSRLTKTVLGHYMFYMANRETRKAGCYVKELCYAMWWVNRQDLAGNVALFHMSFNPGPSLREYVESICHAAGIKRLILRVPYHLLYSLSWVIAMLCKSFGFDQPINPIRIRKPVRSNNIVPKYLLDQGHQFRYTLDEAMEDWRREAPEEW